jgi:O-antigen/teichoic acid export membrane protein
VTSPADADGARPAGDDGDRILVLKGLGWSSIAYPLSAALLFASSVLAARMLTKSGFGTYSLAVSIFSTVALIAQLGLPQSLLRRASAALMIGDDHEARHEIVSAFALSGIAAAVCIAVIASPLGTKLLELTFPEVGVAAVAGLIGIRAGLRVLENVVPEGIRAFRDYLRVAIFDGLLTNALLCVAFVAAIVTTAKVSVSDALWLSVVVSIVALIPAFLTVAFKLRHTKEAGFALRNPFEASMWASTIGRAILAQLDLLVVGAVATASEVALYAAPFRLALLVGFPLIAVNQVVTPLIAGWYARGERARLEHMLRSTAGLALLGATVFGLVCVVAGGDLLAFLFGPSYREAATVLAILAVGQVIQTWAGSCGYALMMTGHQRPYAWLLGASTVITVTLDVLFYDRWGIEGIALATTGMLALQNIVQVMYLKRVASFTTTADLRATFSEIHAFLTRRRAPTD